MKKIAIFLILMAISIPSKTSRLKYEAIGFVNDLGKDILIETFPPLRYTGLAEKYIYNTMDSVSGEKSWRWDLGNMHLKILNHDEIYNTTSDTSKIFRGKYLLDSGSGIRLGSYIEEAKLFVGATSKNLIIDSIIIYANGQTMLFDRTTLWNHMTITKRHPKRQFLSKKSPNNYILYLSTLIYN